MDPYTAEKVKVFYETLTLIFRDYLEHQYIATIIEEVDVAPGMKVSATPIEVRP